MWNDVEKKYLIKSNYKDIQYTSEDMMTKAGLVGKVLENISFHNEAVELYEIFQTIFKNVGRELGCKEKKYPVLLPKDTLKKTKYVSKFPHHCIFCSEVGGSFDFLKDNRKKVNYSIEILQNEYLNYAEYVLSPSACYHSYHDYENASIEGGLRLSFEQNVFRNEGVVKEDNSFGRLKSYTIREFVFIGNANYVKTALREAEEAICKVLNKSDLSFCVSKAADSFVLPDAEILKKMQIMADVKHEFRVGYSKEQSIAVGSVNFHNDSFTYPFNIKLVNGEKAISGCVGIGIERILMVYIAQKGIKPENWRL